MRYQAFISARFCNAFLFRLTFSGFDTIMLFEYRSRIRGDGDFVKITRLVFRLSLALSAKLFLFLFFFSPTPLAAADAAAPTDAAPQQQTSADPIDVQGYFSGKFVSRTSRVEGEKIRDDDIFSDLRVDLSKPRTSGYEFHFFGTLRDDLSNNRNRTTFSPFEDIGDTYRSQVHGYLYEAHLDLNRPVAGVSQLRIGRQDGSREEPVFFDGIAADIGLARKLSLTLYGGAAVHFYEIDSRWGDDTLAGAGLDYFPLTGTVISADYLYVTDKRNYFDMTTQRDQLVSFKLGQRFSPNLRANAKVRYVNGDPRDLKLGVVVTVPESDFEVTMGYVRQFRTQNELSNELSAFYDVLGQSFPYESYDVKVRKLFGRHLAADLGYFERSLIHGQQEDAFNRAFRRTYAVFELIDLFIDRLAFSLTGEQWQSGQKRFDSAGFDVSYAFKSGRRSPKISAGSYYSLYKYDDFLSLGERTRVRTYYAKADYPFAKRYFVSGSYELERGLEDYQTIKLGIRYDF